VIGRPLPICIIGGRIPATLAEVMKECHSRYSFPSSVLSCKHDNEKLAQMVRKLERLGNSHLKKEKGHFKGGIIFAIVVYIVEFRDIQSSISNALLISLITTSGFSLMSTAGIRNILYPSARRKPSRIVSSAMDSLV